MKKLLKLSSIILLIILVLIQLVHPTKNVAATPSTHKINTLYNVPVNVEQTLVKACYDCHSNTTKYPWYNNIQPVAWWLNNHINDGKKHLNFDEFTTYTIARQYKKLDDCVKEVKNNDMPLSSYTIIHKDAILTDIEKEALYNWCNAVRDSIKTKYPADSLIMPKQVKNK